MKEYLENKNSDGDSLRFFDEYMANYSPVMVAMYKDDLSIESNPEFREIVEKRLKEGNK